MAYTSQDLELALRMVVMQIEGMGDKNNRAWYYTASDIEKAESYLTILRLLRYDQENRATNFSEIRDQISNALMGPYIYLQMTIPLMNDQGFTLLVKEILEKVLPWLKKNQIIWFKDYQKEPGLVSVYPTDQNLKLKPTENTIAVHWQPLIVALVLFLPTELCDHIRQNAESRAHFMALLFSYQVLEENLKRKAG